MSNTYRYRRGPLDHKWIAKSATVAVQIGDMLKMETGNTGNCTPVSASTDVSGLIGVAMSASPTTDTTGTKVRVGMLNPSTVWEYDTASGTFVVGDSFEITSAQGLGERTITDIFSSGSMVVALIAENYPAAGTKILVSFLNGRFQRETSAT